MLGTRYGSMKELYDAYGGDDMDRGKMSFEEEITYLRDYYATRAGVGFSKTFHSPFEDEGKYNGMAFTVVKALTYAEDDVDTECLPMWRIRMEDGTELDAYPEEICPDDDDCTLSPENGAGRGVLS